MGGDFTFWRTTHDAPHPGPATAEADLAAFIFNPGFSTAAKADADAGRGMGLDIIKHHVVDEAGGEIAVRSQPGAFCEFTCLFPSETTAAVS